MASLLLKRLHVYFKTNNRAGVALSFSASILLSLVLLIARVWRTGELTYVFLLWNLFLAMIPLGLSTFLTVYRLRHKSRFASIVITLSWLLFLPNSFYIITDLFHLHPRTGVPQWFDLLLILSFAWNGIMLGCASLFDMHELLKHRFSNLLSWFFVTIALMLSGFGIYLGRFERWNTWDVLHHPFRLFSSIFNYTMDPSAYPEVWGISFLYGVLMLVLYATVYQLTHVQGGRYRAELVAGRNKR